jgi:peroxiredoxin
MKNLFRALLLLAAIGMSASAWAQADSKETPRKEPPPVHPPTGAPQFRARITGDVIVGELAPDFELDGSSGKPVKLSSYRGRWLLLVFGDRKEALTPLRESYADLDSMDMHIVGVCAEKAYNLVAFAKHEAFPFMLLADVTREISDMYGLYDAQERKVLPGFLVINPAGEVRLALLGQSLPPADVVRLAKYVASQL